MILKVYADSTIMLSRIVGITPYSKTEKAKVRLIEGADSQGKLVDICAGKKAQSFIVTDSGHIWLTPVSAESLWKRLLDK